MFISNLTDIECPKLAQKSVDGTSRCGPDYGICNRDINSNSLYCQSAAHMQKCDGGDYRSAAGDEYDWWYCPGRCPIDQ